MELITRKSAQQLNMTRYFTGKPCKRGHIASRLTSCGKCSVCLFEHDIKYTKKHLVKRQAR